MLKMTISDWKKRIDLQLEAGLYNRVLINGSRDTQEITNFEYCLIPEEVDLVSPPVEEETTERNYVLKRSIAMYETYLSKDLNSRQGAFVNNYDGADNHCISYFHHYVRCGKYCMNVYVRSMNYLDNFVFDCQTFNLAYKTVYEKLKIQYKNKVELGYMRVFVFSLHVYA